MKAASTEPIIFEFDGLEFDNHGDYLDALKNSENRYKAYTRWTEEDDQSLKKLSQTMSLMELCDHFKRMPSGIKARLLKLNINQDPIISTNGTRKNRERWTEVPEGKISNLDKKSISVSEIAKRMGWDLDEMQIKRAKIQKLLKDRGIEKLIHFTDKKNLPSIKKYGLRPINALKLANIEYYYNDKYRYDQQLNGISLSVTYLNKDLFKAFAKKRKTDWVELEIDPQVITMMPCLFYDHNAASYKFNKMSDDLSTYEALEGMFADSVTTTSKKGEIKRENQKPNQTTSAQAEIIVQWGILESQILKVKELNG